jgi:hypothetical protein
MMQVPINVKSPNNSSKWQMGFNSVFNGLSRNVNISSVAHPLSNSVGTRVQGHFMGIKWLELEIVH